MSLGVEESLKLLSQAKKYPKTYFIESSSSAVATADFDVHNPGEEVPEGAAAAFDVQQDKIEAFREDVRTAFHVWGGRKRCSTSRQNNHSKWTIWSYFGKVILDQLSIHKEPRWSGP